MPTMKLLFPDKPSPYQPQKIVCVEKPVAELMSRKTHQIHFSCSYEGLERILMLYVNNYEIGGRSFDVEKSSSEIPQFSNQDIFAPLLCMAQ
ncbi:MAG: hypothetical protein IPN10_00470 [Saprospiraceae bacterium]|nr:hypothetical protein [Saprospiraceae bacterium]